MKILPNLIDPDHPIAHSEPYMKLQGEQYFETENYVSTPPALLVLEGNRTMWTLGFNRIFSPKGEFAYDVLKDGVWTGEWASRIERRAGRIKIFTPVGSKTWNGRSFT
jgi:hypothetical protein